MHRTGRDIYILPRSSSRITVLERKILKSVLLLSANYLTIHCDLTNEDIINVNIIWTVKITKNLKVGRITRSTEVSKNCNVFILLITKQLLLELSYFHPQITKTKTVFKWTEAKYRHLIQQYSFPFWYNKTSVMATQC